jgi:hypothetical protein
MVAEKGGLMVRDWDAVLFVLREDPGPERIGLWLVSVLDQVVVLVGEPVRPLGWQQVDVLYADPLLETVLRHGIVAQMPLSEVPA